MALTLGEIEAILKARDELTDVLRNANARRELEVMKRTGWSWEPEPDPSPVPLSLVVAGVIGAVMLANPRVSRRNLFRPWAWASASVS